MRVAFRFKSGFLATANGGSLNFTSDAHEALLLTKE